MYVRFSYTIRKRTQPSIRICVRTCTIVYVYAYESLLCLLARPTSVASLLFFEYPFIRPALSLSNLLSLSLSPLSAARPPKNLRPTSLDRLAGSQFRSSFRPRRTDGIFKASSALFDVRKNYIPLATRFNECTANV